MPAKKKSLPPAASVYTLKITLLGIQPPVWRKIQVRGDTNLGRLHRVIQCAFGWEEAHLHEFQAAGKRFGPKTEEELGFGKGIENEAKAILGELLPKKGKKLSYTYDFGDGWDHAIEVEEIAPPVGGRTYPSCIDGARACPPEDCGGPWGYDTKLKALKDPEHPEHAEIAEWMGEFDPEEFDLGVTNAAVSRVK